MCLCVSTYVRVSTYKYVCVSKCVYMTVRGVGRGVGGEEGGMVVREGICTIDQCRVINVVLKGHFQVQMYDIPVFFSVLTDLDCSLRTDRRHRSCTTQEPFSRPN